MAGAHRGGFIASLFSGFRLGGQHQARHGLDSPRVRGGRARALGMPSTRTGAREQLSDRRGGSLFDPQYAYTHQQGIRAGGGAFFPRADASDRAGAQRALALRPV